MNIVEFAEREMGLKLSYFQKDLLEILQANPDGLYHCIKFDNQDMRIVQEVYNSWKESMLVSV